MRPPEMARAPDKSSPKNPFGRMRHGLILKTRITLLLGQPIDLLMVISEIGINERAAMTCRLRNRRASSPAPARSRDADHWPHKTCYGRPPHLRDSAPLPGSRPDGWPAGNHRT